MLKNWNSIEKNKNVIIFFSESWDFSFFKSVEKNLDNVFFYGALPKSTGTGDFEFFTKNPYRDFFQNPYRDDFEFERKNLYRDFRKSLCWRV